MVNRDPNPGGEAQEERPRLSASWMHMCPLSDQWKYLLTLFWVQHPTHNSKCTAHFPAGHKHESPPLLRKLQGCQG